MVTITHRHRETLNKMKIRKATKKDLKEIAKILKKVFNDKPYKDKWTDKKSLEHVKHEFRIAEIFVLKENKNIVGMIVIRKNVGPKWKVAEIKDFAIVKKHRGRGIGSLFIKETEKVLKKKGYGRIFLETYNKSKAVDFYKKNNYKLSKHTAFMIKKLK